ncbi:MAG: Bax inhibitor-1/YccA family protein [Pseudomonadota bacterium]
MIDYTKRAFIASDSKEFDAGLREYMLKIYNYMTLALVVTGIAAYATLNFEPLTRLMFEFSPSGQFMGNTGFGTLVMLSPLAIVFYFFWGIGTMDVSKAKTLLWVYAGLSGMSLASLGFIYTGESIAKTFFVCAGTFAGTSIYGYTTNRDLTSIGSFLVMGLIGLIVASLANMFFQSAAIYFVTSVVGVVIFIGLIAWDTQKLKQIYYTSGGGERGQTMAVLGAFTLYLDFINLFIYLLRFLGVRRSND